MILELDTETDTGQDFTSDFLVLTHTPNADIPVQCQGLIKLSSLSSVAGLFELTIKIDDIIIAPSPTIVEIGAVASAIIAISEFPVYEAGVVKLSVKSPNSGDTTVDYTSYLYDVNPFEMAHCDWYIDDTETPWEIVFHASGDTGTEYARKQLKTIDDSNIIATNVPVGQHINV